MELRVLNYFLMVSQEENITKAAQLLHVTQPTLSRQLMQLEDELGVKLFERSNHSIVLTSDGLLLKRRAQEIVSLAEKTKRELTTEKELSGEIEIAAGEFKSFSLFGGCDSSVFREASRCAVSSEQRKCRYDQRTLGKRRFGYRSVSRSGGYQPL